MTLSGQISRRIIAYGIDLGPMGGWGLGKFLPQVGGWPTVDAAGGGTAFYEVLCRGPSKCGTFVSVRPLDACPKCGSKKILRGAGQPPAETKT
jgi:hypothetical protein